MIQLHQTLDVDHTGLPQVIVGPHQTSEIEKQKIERRFHRSRSRASVQSKQHHNLSKSSNDSTTFYMELRNVNQNETNRPQIYNFILSDYDSKYENTNYFYS